LIVVSHSTTTIRRYCDAAAVLDRGNLIFFDDLTAAIDHYEYLNNNGTGVDKRVRA
jgi:capsular polysaccharide transport system ATP-binding protein